MTDPWNDDPAARAWARVWMAASALLTIGAILAIAAVIVLAAGIFG